MSSANSFKRSDLWAFLPVSLTPSETFEHASLLLRDTLGSEASVVVQEADWPEKFHHWVRVTRVRVGETVTLIDETRKLKFFAAFETIGKHAVTLSLLKSEPLLLDSCSLTACVALVKPERWEWMLEKLTELGVQRIIPLQTERTQKHVKDLDKSMLRWQRIIQTAAEQSEQLSLPRLASPQRLSDVSFSENCLKLAALERLPFEEGENKAQWPKATASMQEIAFVIGPEGGWSQAEEVILADAGYCPVSLGARILRTETAAMALASILNDRYRSCQ